MSAAELSQSALEARILQALDRYSERVSAENLRAAKEFVEYVMTEEVDRETLETEIEEEQENEIEKWRTKWLLWKFGSDEEDLIHKPQDIITHWDRFALLNGLNGAARSGMRDPSERKKRMDEYIRGLQDGLQELGGDAAALPLPEDFLILLRHVDTLEGHQWFEQKNHQHQVIFFSHFVGYDKAKAQVRSRETLRGGSAYAWGNRYPDFYSVIAGLETGYAPEGGCHIIYGRREPEEEPRWWYHVNLGQFGTKMFETLIDLLQWYQEFNIPSRNDIEGGLWGLWDFGF